MFLFFIAFQSQRKHGRKYGEPDWPCEVILSKFTQGRREKQTEARGKLRGSPSSWPTRPVPSPSLLHATWWHEVQGSLGKGKDWGLGSSTYPNRGLGHDPQYGTQVK